MKGHKLDKSKFVTKSVGIIDTIIFMYVSFSNQIASKTFATQCFFTDYLNHKIVKKQPVERSQQILTNYGHIS